MPEPQQDTVRVKMPDGKMWNLPRVNLEKAKARGAVEIQAPTQPNTFRSATESLRGGMGLKPEGGVEDDLKQIGSGIKREFTHPIDSAKLLLEGLYKGQQDVFEKGTERFNKPGVMNKVTGAAQVAESGIPGVGPILSAAGEQAEKGDYAGMAGTMLPAAFGMAAETPIGARAGVAAADAAGNVVASPIREALGVSERAVAKAQAEHAAKMADVQLKNIQAENSAEAEHSAALKQAEEDHAKAVADTRGSNIEKQNAYQLKVQQLKEDHANKVAKIQREHKEEVSKMNREHEDAVSAFKNPGEETQSARSTQAQNKKDFSLGKGPMYQRVSGMADQLASTIPDLAKKVRETYNSRWGAWREAMGADTTGDFSAVQRAVKEAQDSLLGQPENIKIFNDILKEGENPVLAQASVFRGGGSGVDIKDLNSKYMSQASRNRIDQFMREVESSRQAEAGSPAVQVTELPIDDIRQYSTDLKSKMYGSYDPKIYKALKMVQDAAEGVVGDVAKSKGQYATWQRLKNDWSQMLTDFNSPQGALYKLNRAPHANARIEQLTGSNADNIIEAMGRYSKFNPDINGVGRLRSLVRQINELPSSAKAPVRPERIGPTQVPGEPNIPAAPKLKVEPEFKPPVKKEVTPQDVIPFDLPKFVEEAVTKRANKVGTAGHTLMAYWVIRDLFHGQMPSASMIAAPFVQAAIKRYLTSPGFLKKIETMVAQ